MKAKSLAARKEVCIGEQNGKRGKESGEADNRETTDVEDRKKDRSRKNRGLIRAIGVEREAEQRARSTGVLVRAAGTYMRGIGWQKIDKRGVMRV